MFSHSSSGSSRVGLTGGNCTNIKVASSAPLLLQDNYTLIFIISLTNQAPESRKLSILLSKASPRRVSPSLHNYIFFVLRASIGKNMQTLNAKNSMTHWSQLKTVSDFEHQRALRYAKLTKRAAKCARKHQRAPECARIAK